MHGYASDFYIKKAVSTLVEYLGVKDEANCFQLEALFQDKDLTKGAQALALHMGLSININIEFGEKNIQTEGLARTDKNGHGIEGAIAQVRIPTYLPNFGTPELENYPIEVFVGPDYRNHRSTLMAILVHELSHVLLHSMRSKYANDEIYADLVGPVLGLATVVGKGRKKTLTESRADGIYTQTITYGYLTDEQFSQVKQEISRVMLLSKNSDKAAEAEIVELERLCGLARKQISKFKGNLSIIDKHPRGKISEAEAVRLVAFHQSNYLVDFLNVLQECTAHIEQVTTFIRLSRHYTKKRISELEYLRGRTRIIAARLLSESAKLSDDIDLIKNCTRFRLKLFR